MSNTATDPQHKPDPGRRDLFALVAVSIVAALVYLLALTGDFIWDDRRLVTGDGTGYTLRETFTHPFLDHYFRPLTSLSFYVERRLCSLTAFHRPVPIFYHQTNILIHVATTAVLFKLLRVAFSERPRAALLGALVFAVQPAQAGAVAWIGGRTDVLSTLLLTASFVPLVVAARGSPRPQTPLSQERESEAYAHAQALPGTGGEPSRLLLASSAVLFGLALFAKEQALVALPLVPLAFLSFAPPGARRPGAGRLFRLSLGHVAATLALLGGWRLVLAPIPVTYRSPIPFGGVTVLHYTLELFAPFPALLHSLTLGRFDSGRLLWGLVGYGILVAASILFARSIRLAPRTAWLIALTALPLLPVSNLLPTPSLVVAPYRVALCGPGAAALLGLALATLFDRAPRMVAIGVSTAVVGWFGLLTVNEARLWRTEIGLFQRITRDDPASLLMNTLVANYLRQTGRPIESIRMRERFLTVVFGSEAWRNPSEGLEILRSDPDARRRASDHNGYPDTSATNVAFVLTITADTMLDAGLPANQARPLVQEAIALRPDYVAATYDLGRCALAGNDLAAADQLFRTIGQRAPASALGWLGQGEVCIHEGRPADARLLLKQASDLDPDSERSLRLLAVLDGVLGDASAAADEVTRADDLRARFVVSHDFQMP